MAAANVANGGFRVCKKPFNVNASIFYRCIICAPAPEPSERINDIDLGLTRVIERGGREATVSNHKQLGLVRRCRCARLSAPPSAHM